MLKTLSALRRLSHPTPSRAFSFTYPCPRKLREVVQLSLFEKEPSSSVVNLWQMYHKDRSENVSGYLAKQQYQLFKRHSAHCPLFLVPVRRQGGYFLMIGQVQNHSIVTYPHHLSSSPSWTTSRRKAPKPPPTSS